jgi:hypothetical protein
MKTLLIAIIILAATIALIVCAPSPTPNPTALGRYCVDVGNDVNRVETAYGSILGLHDAQGNPRPATTAEIETAIFDWVEGSTHDYERRQNMSSFNPPTFGASKKYHASTPTPTPKKGK